MNFKNQQDTINNNIKSINISIIAATPSSGQNNKTKNMPFSLPIPSKDPKITIKCR